MVNDCNPNSSRDVDLGILMGLAFSAFVEKLNAHLRHAGFGDLGRWYGYVFRALDAEPLSLRQLAERLEMTSAGAMKIVDEMEARGYVERVLDEADARVKRLRLAARGKKALSAARRFHASFERELGVTRARQLRALLAEIVTFDPNGAPPLLRPM